MVRDGQDTGGTTRVACSIRQTDTAPRQGPGKMSERSRIGALSASNASRDVIGNPDDRTESAETMRPPACNMQ
jgi:hypothetical protein